ncbi:hypothetical protein F2Q69_00050627 [Brassica cretica]|uniref:Uncharacterized protein n=1 Tax=Brassica cretica TaxID=69181 RepID=A0A8S9PLP5_BRACR|nr:hypothetical protein F2Q69_00050627 [Brassica cretica]
MEWRKKIQEAKPRYTENLLLSLTSSNTLSRALSLPRALSRELSHSALTLSIRIELSLTVLSFLSSLLRFCCRRLTS